MADTDTPTVPPFEQIQYANLDASANLEEPVPLKVVGQVPTWLKGSLYRNGPGVFKVGETSWSHLFDGFSVLHKWTINDGKVWFLSTILDCEHYRKCVKYDRLVGPNFGASFPDPCKSIFDRFFSYFKPLSASYSDNACVNIVEFGDKLFALTETTAIVEVDHEKMRTVGSRNIEDTVAVHMATAHPRIDSDGTMYYYSTNFDTRKAYNIVKIPPPAPGEAPFDNAHIVATVPSRWKTAIGYTHDFGMTPNYFVHIEIPAVMSILKLMTMNLTGGTPVDLFKEFPGEPTRVNVINRKTGEKVPITYYGPHGFIFHIINCYEEDNYLICDICFYDKSDVVPKLYLNRMFDPDQYPEAHFERFVLPLDISDAKENENLVKLAGSKATAMLQKGSKDVINIVPDNPFGNVMFELPRINPKYNTKDYRYFYGCTVFNFKSKKLFKFDVKTNTVKEWKSEETHQPSEPVFIESPDALEEDDGVILAAVLSTTTDYSSYLIILDASSFNELARAEVPSHIKINMAFHGEFSKGTL